MLCCVVLVVICSLQIHDAMSRLNATMKQFAEDVSIRPIPARTGNDREYAMQVSLFFLFFFFFFSLLRSL